jgi:hypothetical protein
MALRFGSFSRIILNGTHTVALAALASDPRITLGLKLGDGAAVCHRSRRRANRAIAVSPTKKRSSHVI